MKLKELEAKKRKVVSESQEQIATIEEVGLMKKFTIN